MRLDLRFIMGRGKGTAFHKRKTAEGKILRLEEASLPWGTCGTGSEEGVHYCGVIKASALAQEQDEEGLG